MLFKFNQIYKKQLLILGTALCVVSGTSLYIWKYNNSVQQIPKSLWQVLDFYGFSDLKQKKALEKLLKLSGIIKPHESFSTLFPERNDLNLLFEDILYFVELTQQNFTRRQGFQERWELVEPMWMNEHKEENLTALKQIGLINAVEPTLIEPDLVGILGAGMGAMINRVKYTNELLITGHLKINLLALISGERMVTLGIDGSEQQLIDIAKKYYGDDFDYTKLTETDLIKEAFYSFFSAEKIIPEKLIIIDTPAGELPRPTTATTIQELCLWIKSASNDKEIQSIVLVSNQPHVKYQQAIIQSMLEQQGLAHIKFEVIGNKITNLNTVNIQNLIGALGSQIWAQTPKILRNLEEKSHTNIIDTHKVIYDRLMALYSKQPLIYNLIDNNINNKRTSDVAKP